MQRHSTRILIRLAAALIIAAVAACSSHDKQPDPTLANDLALASQAQTAQPQFHDSAPAAEPVQKPAPRPAPARISNPPRTRPVAETPVVEQPQAPVAVVPTPQPSPAALSPAAVATATAPRSIGAGANLFMASQSKVCTTTNHPGDRFVALLSEPVTGVNGAVIPSGASVILEVSSVSADNGTIGVTARSVEFNGMTYPLNGTTTTTSDLQRRRIMTDPNADKKKVIGGAIAGAILGQMIGKNTKGTVIGAAAGAATGAAAAKVTEKFETCLPEGGSMRLTLAQAVVL